MYFAIILVEPRPYSYNTIQYLRTTRRIQVNKVFTNSRTIDQISERTVNTPIRNLITENFQNYIEYSFVSNLIEIVFRVNFLTFKFVVPMVFVT